MKIQTKRSSYSLIQGLGILVNSEIEHELQSLKPDSIDIDEKKVIERLRTDLSDEEIENHICNCRNLTLNITFLVTLHPQHDYEKIDRFFLLISCKMR